MSVILTLVVAGLGTPQSEWGDIFSWIFDVDVDIGAGVLAGVKLSSHSISIPNGYQITNEYVHFFVCSEIISDIWHRLVFMIFKLL